MVTRNLVITAVPRVSFITLKSGVLIEISLDLLGVTKLEPNFTHNVQLQY